MLTFSPFGNPMDLSIYVYNECVTIAQMTYVLTKIIVLSYSPCNLFILSFEDRVWYPRLWIPFTSLIWSSFILFIQSEPVPYVTLRTGICTRRSLVCSSVSLHFLLTKELMIIPHCVPLIDCILWDISAYFLKQIHKPILF